MNPIHVTGWTLLHSVWEFAVIALVLLVVRLTITSARLRYTFGLIGLVLCPIASVVTAFLLSRSDQTSIVASSGPTSAHIREGGATPGLVHSVSQVSPSLLQSPGLESALPWLVIVWQIGLISMSLRFLFSLFAIGKLNRRSVSNTDEQIQAIVAGIANRFGYRRQIEVRISDLIESPATIGFLKAVILLPTSMLVGLNRELLEAIIAHEIAHIKRHDYLLNLIQSLTEVVFFYHPAIWWISATMRAERENRCDDLAVEVLGDRARYTRSLVVLEEMRVGSPSLAVAATGGTLLGRIKRLVGGTQRPTNVGWIYVVIAAIALVSIGFAQIQHKKRVEPEIKLGEIALRGRVIGLDGGPAKGAIIQAIVEDEDRKRIKFVTAMSDDSGEFDFHKKSKYDTVLAYLKGSGYGYGSVKKGSIHLQSLHPVKVRTIDGSGNPLSGVSVTPWSLAPGIQLAPEFQAQMEAKTGPDGTVQVMVPSGVPSFDVLNNELAVESPAQTMATAGGMDETTLIIGKAAKVEGVVSQNGRPLSDIWVHSITNKPYGFKIAQTDSQGHFRLEGLPQGEVIVVTSVPARLRKEGCDAIQHLNLQQGRASTVRLEIKPGVVVKGAVRDPDGHVVPSVTVQIGRIGGHIGSSVDPISIAADGSFTTRLSAGRYQAQVLRSRTSSISYFTVKDGQSVQLNLTAPEEPQTIKAVVLGPDGKPVGDRIQIDYSYRDRDRIEHSSATVTEADGTSIVDVPKSANSVVFWAENGDTFSDENVSPHDGSVVLKLKRIPLVSVTGKVVDSQGRPLKGISVQLGFDSGGRFMGDRREMLHHVTDQNGLYRISGVYPGTRASAMIVGEGFARYMTSDVRVTENPQTMPTVQLLKARTMRGRVIDGNGKPVQNAQVIPESNGWMSGPEPRTDRNGRFKLDNLPPQKLLFKVFRGYDESQFREKDGVEPTYVVKG